MKLGIIDLAIQIPGVLKLAKSLVVQEVRKENVRMLAELKRYFEAQPQQRPDPILTEVTLWKF